MTRRHALSARGTKHGRLASRISIALAAAVAPFAVGVVALPASSASATTLTNYTWSGASTASTNWSDTANWDGTSGAPSATVGTLTFPDLGATADGTGTCDTPPSPPTQIPPCYNSTDDVSLVANGLAFPALSSGSNGYYVAGTSGTSMTLGSGGVSSSQTIPPNFLVPIVLNAAQTWTMSSGGSFDAGSGVSGAVALTTSLSSNTLGAAGDLTLAGATNEVSSFSASAPPPSSPPLFNGIVSIGGLNTTVIPPTPTPGDLNGTNGNPVNLTDVSFSGWGTVGDLTATGSQISPGDGSSTSPGTLTAGQVSLDSSSSLDLSVVGGPASGTAATPGTDNSELVATPNASYSSDAGTVNLGNAALDVSTGGQSSSGTVCYSPTAGTVYTLVSATTLTGAVDSESTSTPTPVPNGGVVGFSTLGSCTTPTTELMIDYNTSVTPETLTGTVVNPTTTTASPAPSPSNSSPGQSVTYSATVAPSSNTVTTAPSGTVTFSVGTTTLCGPINLSTPASGTTATATCQATNAPVGNDTVTATYTPVSGSGFGPSSGSGYEAVQYTTSTTASAATAIANPASSATAGQVVTYSATVANTTTGSTATPAGTVQFTAGATGGGANGSLCVAELFPGAAGSATASCDATSAPSGSDTVTASYSSGPDFQASSGTTSLAIGGQGSNTTISTNVSGTAVAGQMITYSATVAPPTTSGYPNPTGSVTFSVGSYIGGTVTLCTASLSPTAGADTASGSCTASDAPSNGGGVIGVYSGDGNYGGSYNSTLLSSSAQSSAVTASVSSSPVTGGTSVTYSANVFGYSSGGAVAPTGSVTFAVGSTILCTAGSPLASTAFGNEVTGSCSTNLAPAGNDTVSATYSGDTTFGGSAALIGLAVTGNASTTAVTTNPTSASQGGSVSYSATVSPPSGTTTTPSGSVAFFVGGTLLCTATLGSGAGSCSASNAPAGTDTVSGLYSGDTSFYPSSGTAPLTVLSPPVFSADTPPSTATAGQSYSYTFAASGNPTPTYALASGAPSWMSIDSATGALSGTVPSGTASFTYSVAATNSQGAATSGPFTVTVLSPPVFSADTPPSTATAGQSYSYTFAASGNPTPTYSLASGAPSWLSINSTTGALSGTVPAGTTTFTYSVTATNTLGAPTAGPFTVTVYTIPAEPTGVGASAGVDSAGVTWSEPTTGGAPSSFAISSSPATTPMTASGTSSSVTVSGLQAGVAYTFTVTAVNPGGDSTPSAPSNSVVPTATPPQGVQSSSAANPTATSATITATATGTPGTLTVATYASDPVAAFSTGTAYFDVSISSGSNFSSVSFTVCGMSSGQTVFWWTPAGQAFQPVSDQTAVNTAGCATVTVNDTTTPDLAEMYGTVFAVGSTPATPTGSGGSPTGVTTTTTTTTTTPTATSGYWLAASDGGIFSFGDAAFYGSTGNLHLNAPIVGITATPDGHGYWLVASDGGVFSFGDANFYGSMGGQHLNAPIVGITATPDGHGYWLVASDGGVFSFGDAAFYGSTGNITLNKPIVGITATPDGHGYWLVASDGGVFSFGDAAFYGSTGNITLNKPIVGITATPDGHGYWLVASDGGVFSFGDAAFYGSTGNITLNKPIVGITATPDGHGYWLVASDGGVFSFGDAAFYGSMGGQHLNAPVVGIGG